MSVALNNASTPSCAVVAGALFVAVSLLSATVAALAIEDAAPVRLACADTKGAVPRVIAPGAASMVQPSEVYTSSVGISGCTAGVADDG